MPQQTRLLTRLEIGAGYAPTPGYLTCDANTNCPVDVHCSADDLPFPAAIFDEVRAVDILEHMPYRATVNVLKEWARVMRCGGRLFVQTPNAARIMRWALDTPDDLDVGLPAELTECPIMIRAAWRLLGGQNDGAYARDGDDWRFNAHYALFDEESLGWVLDRAGFDVVSLDTNPFPNLQCWAVKR